jgi:hypothetical protein
MKNLRNAFITLLLLMPAVLFAQNAGYVNKIDFIKAQFSTINNNIRYYKKVVRDDAGQTTEGGEATGYFKDGEIKKITTIYYGETGKASEEYYFFDKKLIFYYSFTQRYEKPFYIGKVKIVSKNEDRYYFDDGSIIKYINKPIKKIAPDELVKTASETQNDVKRLLTLLRHPALAE